MPALAILPGPESALRIDDGMNKFDEVDEKFGELEYMRREQAEIIQRFVRKHDIRDMLEIGFFHGKSSAYFAAMLEDLGRGHLVTIDMRSARKREPNIDTVLSTLSLAHRVTPVYAHRSYTWELAKMIREKNPPQFDFCYFDGDHTWDGTGFGFLLVDVLLRPGGWILFDDLKWTIKESLKDRAKPPRHWVACDEDEQATPAVQLVFDQLVPHLGYTDLKTYNNGWWGIARKPLDRTADQGLSGRIRSLLR